MRPVPPSIFFCAGRVSANENSRRMRRFHRLFFAGGAGGKGHDGPNSPVEGVSPHGHCRSFDVKWAENGKFWDLYTIVP